jgi:hypothetical protein
MARRIKAIDGLPVMDAKRPVRLKIIPADIQGANVKEPDDCAIARACRRQLHVIEARVHLTRTYLRTNTGNWVRYATPPAARAEIIAFDRGGRFVPSEFILKPVPERDRLGAPRRGGKATGKKGKRRGHHVVKDVRTGPAW